MARVRVRRAGRAAAAAVALTLAVVGPAVAVGAAPARTPATTRSDDTLRELPSTPVGGTRQAGEIALLVLVPFLVIGPLSGRRAREDDGPVPVPLPVPAAGPPVGWYPVHGRPGAARYWDGRGWSEVRGPDGRPVTAPVPA